MQNQTPEHVVLVNEQDIPMGTALKSEVHTKETPLHRAFSCFLFRKNGNLILQQRAHTKKTWPGVWSNTCCGHPLPNESRTHAVHRRLRYELGIQNIPMVEEVLPDFRYKAEFQSVVENELCPVFVGFTKEPLHPNPDEVAQTQEVSWKDLVRAVCDPEDSTWDHLSVWCREEIQLLHQSPRFQALWKKVVG